MASEDAAMARRSRGTSATLAVDRLRTLSEDASTDNPDLHDRLGSCPPVGSDQTGTPEVRPRCDDDQGGEPPCWAFYSEVIDDDYLYWPLD